jgi:hypothetical protein
MGPNDELDVDAVVQGRAGDERELLAVWNLVHERGTWAGILRKDPDNAVARGALDQLPEAGPLEALAANARLVDLLTGRRWYVMRDAREAGTTWSEIGQALGMTRQGAQDYYRRAITKQEQYVGGLHDAARARAVVDENDGTPKGSEAA